MDGPRATLLVGAALRCYPARWRRRHGDEAAELAVLLIRDGRPAAAVAWSYLVGAAREWLTPRPGRRLSTAAWALLAAACSLGVSAALVTSAGPARAASTSQARGHVHCSPAPPGFLTRMVPAQGNSLVIVRKAGHDQPC